MLAIKPKSTYFLLSSEIKIKECWENEKMYSFCLFLSKMLGTLRQFFLLFLVQKNQEWWKLKSKILSVLWKLKQIFFVVCLPVPNSNKNPKSAEIIEIHCFFIVSWNTKTKIPRGLRELKQTSVLGKLKSKFQECQETWSSFLIACPFYTKIKIPRVLGNSKQTYCFCHTKTKIIKSAKVIKTGFFFGQYKIKIPRVLGHSKQFFSFFFVSPKPNLNSSTQKSKSKWKQIYFFWNTKIPRVLRNSKIGPFSVSFHKCQEWWEIESKPFLFFRLSLLYEN